MLHESQLRAVNQAIHKHRVRRGLEIAPAPAPLSCQVTGVERGCVCDINTVMLSPAQSRLEQAYATDVRAPKEARWQVIAGDAFHVPFRDTFDMVYTFRFLRRFEACEREVLYAQILSHLKPRGLFAFDAVNAQVAGPLWLKEGQTNYPI